MATSRGTGKSSRASKSQSPTSSSLSMAPSTRKSAKFKDEEERETLAYKVLTADQTKQLAEKDDVDSLQEKMAEILKITDGVTGLQDGAVLDYYVAAFWWGKEQSYTIEQLSASFTVIHTLLDNIKEKQSTVTDNMKTFRKMLAGIGQDHPDPACCGGLEACFDLNSIKPLSDYLHMSLFQHHKLYELMFSSTQAEEIIGTDLELEVPKAADMPWPPPLEEGVSEDIYTEYIATPPPTPIPQEGEAQEGDEEAQAEAKAAAAAAAAVDQHEADVLSKLTAEEVKAVLDSVFEQMLGGLKADVASKLREKENSLINRINKIHVVEGK